MSVDKFFHLLAGIGWGTLSFWLLTILTSHSTKPGYRASGHYGGPTNDEMLSVILPLATVLVSTGITYLTLLCSAYGETVGIGYLTYTSVRFYNESRERKAAVGEVPKPL